MIGAVPHVLDAVAAAVSEDTHMRGVVATGVQVACYLASGTSQWARSAEVSVYYGRLMICALCIAAAGVPGATSDSSTRFADPATVIDDLLSTLDSHGDTPTVHTIVTGALSQYAGQLTRESTAVPSSLHRATPARCVFCVGLLTTGAPVDQQ